MKSLTEFTELAIQTEFAKAEWLGRAIACFRVVLGLAVAQSHRQYRLRVSQVGVPLVGRRHYLLRSLALEKRR